MKINKIFSSILVLAMLCSFATVAFAAPASMENYYTLEISASAKSVAVGESVTASVYLYSNDDAETIELNKGLSAVNVQVLYDADKLAYASATNDADNFTLTNNAADNGEFYTWEATLNASTVSIAKDVAMFTITFTAKEDIADITADIFSTRSICVVDDDFNGAESSMLMNVETSVTVAASGPVDIAEDFASASEAGSSSSDTSVASKTIKYGIHEVDMGANGVIHTYFAKAANDLTAYEYGVKATIGGVTYKFPGIENITAGKNWAIKIVVPNGKFASGEDASTVTAFEKY